MKVTSPSFEQYHTIPQRYTGDGEDLSPGLVFSEVPKGAKTYAVIVEDPDAPNGTFDHWLAWNIPAEEKGLKEGEKPPQQGVNGFGSKGYRGPHPPPGSVHRYFFRVYALDTALDLPSNASKAALMAAMQGHILSQSELVGTYSR